MMYETSPLLHFAEDRLQLIALPFMAVVYAIKIRWILRFPAGRERQASTAQGRTNAQKGALWSLASIAMPWAMASTRQHPPDDYFSLFLLIVWLGFSVLAAPNDRQAGEAALLGYFFLTAFFLIYVPFSKISHYIYYPFARYYLGRTLGYRGVYPVWQRS